jgi:YD repeat-containing protein
MRTPLLCLFLAAASLAENVKYSYDDLGRLIRAEYTSGLVISYSYDKAGNLTKREVTGSATPQKTAAPAKAKKVAK